jgi:hypothetical protein
MLQSRRDRADSGRLRRCLVLWIGESSQGQHSAVAAVRLHSSVRLYPTRARGIRLDNVRVRFQTPTGL